MERQQPLAGCARLFVAPMIVVLAGCGGGASDDGASLPAMQAKAAQPLPQADLAEAAQPRVVERQAPRKNDPAHNAKLSSLLLSNANEGWLQIAGGVPAPITTWNADPPGAYVRSTKAAIASPPAGTSNAAQDELARKYPGVLRDLKGQGIGASTVGTHRDDDFTANSFAIGRFPEESLDDNAEHTYHKYGIVTYLGRVDAARGITREWVIQSVLVARYGFPAWRLSPTPINADAASAAYAVSPLLAADIGNLARPTLYVTDIGSVEQVRVPAGVVNITTVNHTMYPGTTRRSAVEFEGGLYIFTTGSGVNRYNNSGSGIIPWRPVHTALRETYQSGYAFGNDNYGPLAFQTLDQQAVQYVNTIRGADL